MLVVASHDPPHYCWNCVSYRVQQNCTAYLDADAQRVYFVSTDTGSSYSTFRVKHYTKANSACFKHTINADNGLTRFSSTCSNSATSQSSANAKGYYIETGDFNSFPKKRLEHVFEWQRYQGPSF